MKVLEFSARWYDLPVFFLLLILLYSTYLVYRLLTSFCGCLFYLCNVSHFFSPPPHPSFITFLASCLRLNNFGRLFHLGKADSVSVVRNSLSNFTTTGLLGYILLLIFLDTKYWNLHEFWTAF